MKITLVSLILTLENSSTSLGGNCSEPLGICYLASYLKREGHVVKIISDLVDSENILSQITATNPDLIGFSTTITATWPRVVEYSQSLKKSLGEKVKIVVGGEHVSAVLHRAIADGIDFGITGEGEQSFLKLINCIESGCHSYEEIPGLIYRKAGDVIINHSHPLINDLDQLPFPERDARLLSKTKIGYLMYPAVEDQKFMISVLASRGCPYNCNFCTSPNVWGHKIRYRSTDNVITEIKDLKRRFNNNILFFPDLTLNANPFYLMELSNKLKEENLGVSWFSLLRLMSPNGTRMITRELLRAMREGGARKIGLGIESLSHDIQDGEVKKATDLKYVKEVIEICHELGIIVKGFLMIGYPQETHETVLETIHNLKFLGIDEVRISYLTPFPGTPLYDNLKLKGLLLTEDLAQYDAQTPIIKCAELSTEDLIDARSKILSEYYGSEEYKLMVSKKVKNNPELARSYEMFFKHLKKKGVMKF